ncbi:MAG TPA: SDR family oxidoreductase [Myxococcota bacterium]|nr:SDR family oxidoreductase [Myxococcota bacterium]
MSALAGRVALVTGAGRALGLGAAIARELAGAGADVFVTWCAAYDQDRGLRGDPRDPTLLLEDLRARGVRAEGMDLDLSDASAPGGLLERVESCLGTVDVLVNNAAHSVETPIETLDGTLLDAHYAVNVRAMALLCAEFVRRRGSRRGGRIVNLTSGQGMGPMPRELAYAATKGAVEAFTVSLASAVAAQGITVNAVDPGPTDTGWMSLALRQALEEASPQGRVGRPEDAARLVRFLASDDAAWITGQIVRSRGGMV